MSLTPKLHAWHNGKVAELTAMAGYPVPALPAGFTAKDVSDRCSEWYWEQFATCFSPKNQTDSIQAQLRVLALGNSLKGYVTDFHRLVNLNAVAIRLNGAANEKSISDREKLDWFKDGIIRNPVQGRYLASQVNTIQINTQLAAGGILTLDQAIKAVRAAYNARNFTDADLVARSRTTTQPSAGRFQPYGGRGGGRGGRGGRGRGFGSYGAPYSLHPSVPVAPRGRYQLPQGIVPTPFPQLMPPAVPQTPVVPRTPMAPRAPRTPSTRGSFQQPGTPSRRGNPFTPQTPTRRSTFTPANYPTPSGTPGAAAAICYRCGCQGHYARNCNAKTDVEGNVISINAYQGAEEGNTGEDKEGGPTDDDGPVFADFHNGCA
ncbi:hypothetical protein HKX48_002589 [Thoreauomyces humboldtii]|nr:hypothetical protein HKX48_002589 [Thoreauomyces humboldtii]